MCQVQVITYGTIKQRLTKDNVTTINKSDIQKQPVSNQLITLEGRVPGLIITQRSDIQGDRVTVRIQGQNSISKGNDPLYVIDGIRKVSGGSYYLEAHVSGLYRFNTCAPDMTKMLANECKVF